MLAIDPSGVRSAWLVPGMDYAGAGSSGAPDRASAERGRKLLELKIDAALRQIATLTGQNP
jgi:creatinine amidohydrolase/Fe(II)-dependent formamide hydrolase-like protein